MSSCAPLANVTLEDLLDAFADRVADRVAQRLAASGNSDGPTDRWFTTREAAEHLGIHPDTLRKLAAARAIPFEQHAPGCALYFRSYDLSRWRESGGPRRPVAQEASTRLPPTGKAR